MSLARVNRVFAMALPRVQARVAVAPAAAVRRMSDESRKKESSMEKDFVARQERETLKRMLNKMESDADPGHKKARAALEQQLQAKGVKVTPELLDSMIAWRQQAH